MGSDILPQDEEGNIANEPPDDELSPLVPEELLLPQRPFPVMGPTWKTFPNPTTPKRDPQSPPPTDPDSEAPRADSDSFAQGDLDFSQCYTHAPPPSNLITVAREQLTRAGEEPTRGWPAYSAPYPEGNPAEEIRDPVFGPKNFLILEASHGRVLGDAIDPLASALGAAKDVKVGPGEFRALGGNAHMLRPLTGWGF